jgi:hypothetical protein
MNIYDVINAHAERLLQQDFDLGATQQEHWRYYAQAEAESNAMSNVELLDYIFDHVLEDDDDNG